ncbi:site-2 protease family protein, partial [Candidatus Falkowbacteria bacterium]|nr:site-2 protease family protein [Candidatus Falkowbacteria bacterium]
MNFDLILLVVNFLVFYLALSVHEFSHALLAYYYGDKTAQQAGRLTLNPLAHIDLFGTVLLPLFLILSNSGIVVGWAKPVPVNFYNLRDQKWGPAIVSLAGPAANFIFAVFSLITLKLVFAYTNLTGNNLLVNFLFLLIIINLVLMVFNLIPIPPLDGSKILFAILQDKYIRFKIFLEQYGLIILI